MKLYKLTNQDSYTRNKIHWEIGVTVSVTIEGSTLCTSQVIHAYTSPLLAELLNPLHANLKDDKILYECEGDIVVSDHTKVGVKSLTPIKRINIPEITIIQKVAFGILVALEVYNDIGFARWTERWLSNIDRSYSSALAAHNNANNAAYTARAAYNANAATKAAAAARASSYAASRASYASYASSYTSSYADIVAEAASYAAEAAVNAGSSLNL